MTVPQGTPERHTPNILFIAAGIVVITAGVGLAALGVEQVLRVDSLRGNGPVDIADGVARVFWGFIVLTIGMYLCRAARRRGWRDRLGRVLIVAGYLVLGAGLDAAVHAGVPLASTGSEAAAQHVVNEVAIRFFGYGLIAVLLAFPGFKLTKEKVLLTARAEF